jgi:hypothetical protein
VKTFFQFVVESSETPLHEKIRPHIPKFVEAAQKHYDEWGRPGSTYLSGHRDGEGICDYIGAAMSKHMIENGIHAVPRAERTPTPHTHSVAYDQHDAYKVDIPHHHYEQPSKKGGWEKIPNVKFGPEHVSITPTKHPRKNEVDRWNHVVGHSPQLQHLKVPHHRGSITEAERANTGYVNYHDWGLIAPSGKLVSGPKHPTARNHEQLKQAVEASHPKHNIHHYAEYADAKDHGLSLRTNHNSASVGAALKGLKTIPSSTEMVHHEHDAPGPTGSVYNHKSGSETQVRNHLKGLHATLVANEAARNSASSS